MGQGAHAWKAQNVKLIIIIWVFNRVLSKKTKKKKTKTKNNKHTKINDLPNIATN